LDHLMGWPYRPSEVNDSEMLFGLGETIKIREAEQFVVPLTRPAGAGHPLPSGEGLARKLFAMVRRGIESCGPA
jgi:hypothetical protein